MRDGFRGEDMSHFERRNERVIRVQIGDDLKAAGERDDLPFDMAMQYSGRGAMQLGLI